MPYCVEITEVGDLNGDGAIDLEDVEILLRTNNNVLKVLDGDGDFRSEECLNLLEQADVVVTNPPFSLFRTYVHTLVKHDKKYLILGDQNALTYKEIFPLIRDNKLWLGFDNGGTKWFQVPDHYEIATESRKKIVDGIKYFSMGRIQWFTNLDHTKRHENLVLVEKYDPDRYPNYDNYAAIEVSRVADIPEDYNGVMGVPITFINKYNPEQFQIIGATESEGKGFSNGLHTGGAAQAEVNGKRVYKRIFIKRIGETS